MEDLDFKRFMRRKNVLDESGEPIHGLAYEKAIIRWREDPGHCWKTLRRHFEPNEIPRDPRTLTREDLENFVGYSASRKNVPQTYCARLMVLHRGMKLAADKYGFMPLIAESTWQVFNDIPDEDKNEKRRGKYRSPHLIATFIKLLSEKSEPAKDQVIIAVHTALRWAEINAMEIDWVRPVDGNPNCPALLDVKHSKTGKFRTIPLNRHAYDASRRQIARRAEQGVTSGSLWAVKSYRKQRENVCREMSLEHNLTLRDLRASWATDAKRAGMSQQDRMAFMGHTSETAHNIYLKDIKEHEEERALALVFNRPGFE